LIDWLTLIAMLYGPHWLQTTIDNSKGTSDLPLNFTLQPGSKSSDITFHLVDSANVCPQLMQHLQQQQHDAD
jgi:hypothetical protein